MATALLLHNIRSVHNVGSLLRTCDGLGVDEIIFSGYTPYPRLSHDERLPHLIERQTKAIHKTALGAEERLALRRESDPKTAIENYRQKGYRILGLEQTAHSVPLAHYQRPEDIMVIVGEEVTGIEPALIALCDDIVEIPMRGHKESFNVSVAGAIALYVLTRHGS